MGNGVVKLADAVVAAADEREHLAGVGIERDERDLGGGDRRRGLAGLDRGADEALMTGCDQGVDLLHAVGDGVLGDLLELRIE